MATPEDILLSKLEWSRATGSERQLRDAAGIVSQRGPSLDRAWLEQWAGPLRVRPLLRRVLDTP